MDTRRGRLLLAAAALAVSTTAISVSAAPGGHGRPTHFPIQVASWQGSVTGTWPGTKTAYATAGCDGVTCVDHVVRISDATGALPADWWQSHPGGLEIDVHWPSAENELDLYVYDDLGNEVTAQTWGGRSHQQVYLYEPNVTSSYHVLVTGVSAVPSTAFDASAQLVAVPETFASVRPTSMRFRSTLVDPQLLVREPGLAVIGDDVYADAPWYGENAISLAWQSTDHARSFRLVNQRVAGADASAHTPCAGEIGGTDSDIAVDGQGRVYTAALLSAGIGVGTWDGRAGDAWHCTTVANTTPENDRPWLLGARTADGPDRPGIDAYLAYIDLVVGQLPAGQDVKPIRIHVDVTTDGGQTWHPLGTDGAPTSRWPVDRSAGTFGTDTPIDGPLFAGPDGTVYMVFQQDEHVMLAIIGKDGRVTTRPISEQAGDPDNNWVLGAVDAGGTLYAAWSERGSYHLLLTSSHNGARTWSTPVTVSPPGQVSVLPWLVAGARGDVALAWYGSDGIKSPDLPQTAQGQAAAWQVYVARSRDADAHHPAFEVAQVSDAPVHLGRVCMLPSCTGSHTDLGDMLTARFAGDGGVVVAYSDNGANYTPTSSADPNVATAHNPFARVARQVAGLGLAPTDAQRDAADTEPAGDAVWPPGDPGGANVAALDLTGLPSVAGSTLSVPLGAHAPADIDAACQAGPGGRATDLYWLFLWRAARHNEYAGAHVDCTDPAHVLSFFGGLDPTPKGNVALDESIAAYPATYALTGGLDSTGLHVELAPGGTSPYVLDGDQALHDLQAFTFTGAGQVSYVNILNLLDSTPSVSPVAAVPHTAG